MLIRQVKLINMMMFASYSKNAKVSKQNLINMNHDYKVVISVHVVIITIL
jgi:hypothetical protein